MTVRTIEADVPSEFPPARLFLDDIEEIVRILVEAIEGGKEVPNRPGQNAKTQVTFTIKDQECDDVQELPKIAPRTTRLSIAVAAQDWLPSATLGFSRLSASLSLYGFTRERKLSIYHSLSPVFKRRKRWSATLAHPLRVLALTLLALLILIMIVVLFTLPSLSHTLRMLGDIVMGLLAVAVAAAAVATTWDRSIIILRPSSERSALRQEMVSRALPVAIGCVLTFLLTVLGMYIKHKYWP